MSSQGKDGPKKKGYPRRPAKGPGKARWESVYLTGEEKKALEKLSTEAGYSSLGRFVAKKILGWHSDEK